MVWLVNSEGVLDGRVAVVTGTSRGVGVGIAHELLRAGATVIGCSRSKLDIIPGADQNEAWLRRSAQMVCDQGDFRAIDAMVTEVADTYGRIDILVNNAGGTVPTPNVEDVPELVQKIQGAPRADDDFERTALFHAFAVQMNLISPLWFALRVYRQMRGQDVVRSRGIGRLTRHARGLVDREEGFVFVQDAGLLKISPHALAPTAHTTPVSA